MHRHDAHLARSLIGLALHVRRAAPQENEELRRAIGPKVSAMSRPRRGRRNTPRRAARRKLRARRPPREHVRRSRMELKRCARSRHMASLAAAAAHLPPQAPAAAFSKERQSDDSRPKESSKRSPSENPNKGLFRRFSERQIVLRLQERACERQKILHRQFVEQRHTVGARNRNVLALESRLAEASPSARACAAGSGCRRVRWPAHAMGAQPRFQANA